VFTIQKSPNVRGKAFRKKKFLLNTQKAEIDSSHRTFINHGHASVRAVFGRFCLAIAFVALFPLFAFTGLGQHPRSPADS
jgi:hypothetical protein